MNIQVDFLLWLSIRHILHVALGILVVVFTDSICRRKYGFPTLAVLEALCYRSKYFKWLVYNVWGNDDWYFKLILSENDGFRKTKRRN